MGADRPPTSRANRATPVFSGLFRAAYRRRTAEDGPFGAIIYTLCVARAGAKDEDVFATCDEILTTLRDAWLAEGADAGGEGDDRHRPTPSLVQEKEE
jgi:hypothetical protein